MFLFRRKAAKKLAESTNKYRENIIIKEIRELINVSHRDFQIKNLSTFIRMLKNNEILKEEIQFEWIPSEKEYLPKYNYKIKNIKYDITKPEGIANIIKELKNKNYLLEDEKTGFYIWNPIDGIIYPIIDGRPPPKIDIIPPPKIDIIPPPKIEVSLPREINSIQPPYDIDTIQQSDEYDNNHPHSPPSKYYYEHTEENDDSIYPQLTPSKHYYPHTEENDDSIYPQLTPSKYYYEHTEDNDDHIYPQTPPSPYYYPHTYFHEGSGKINTKSKSKKSKYKNKYKKKSNKSKSIKSKYKKKSKKSKSRRSK